MSLYSHDIRKCARCGHSRAEKYLRPDKKEGYTCLNEKDCISFAEHGHGIHAQRHAFVCPVVGCMNPATYEKNLLRCNRHRKIERRK